MGYIKIIFFYLDFPITPIGLLCECLVGCIGPGPGPSPVVVGWRRWVVGWLACWLQCSPKWTIAESCNFQNVRIRAWLFVIATIATASESPQNRSFQKARRHYLENVKCLEETIPKFS